MAGSDALGFEKKLWAAADKLRSNMDAAVYKHIVLGLIFLKYISDSFDESHAELKAHPEADEEDEDEYIAKKVFWVPKVARWKVLKNNARQPEIGQLIDDAMKSIEKRNPTLKGVLPKDYSRPQLDKKRLGELVDLISGIGLGGSENRSKDVLGRVYEYFLGEFASAEGKKGGQFYTPRSVVKLLVDLLRPFNGRIYDPCCGSGGMFVQSDLFIKEHGGRIENISLYGQESNPTTWRLFKMNMAIRRLSANIGPEPKDTFSKNLHPDLRADYIIANPPFNLKDWGQPSLLNDPRWRYGIPPKNNANFAWVQHFIHHLNNNGKAGFVLANSSLSSQRSGEGEIRKAIIEADLLDCIIVLPVKLFFNTGIPACIWLISKNKAEADLRNRKGEILMIDGRRMGDLISKKQKELNDKEIEKITHTYRSWIGDSSVHGIYQDEVGFCKSVSLENVQHNEFMIPPGRFVGSPPRDTSVNFSEEMSELVSNLKGHFSNFRELQHLIDEALKERGFE